MITPPYGGQRAIRESRGVHAYVERWAKAGASNFISISMLADGKAPPAPLYYGIIEEWGGEVAREMTTNKGDVGREARGKKKGVS